MSVAANRVRRGYYADSVVLMRVARELSAMADVVSASLMIGTPANKALLRDAGLLLAEGRDAQANDLVIAVKARDAAAAATALTAAEGLLEARPAQAATAFPRARTLAGILGSLPGADLALISVPGAFAAAEARRALESGLHVMMFSDNVPVAEEVALKKLASSRGLLMMGPDCGTSVIGGVPLAFANALPRGGIGLVSASGTGLQEVSCLLARAGVGISHAIGVGGRDLSEAVGGLASLVALDALDADKATRHIVVISKPPAKRVAAKLMARVARSRKSFTLCLLGSEGVKVPRNARLAPTLIGAAEMAAGRRLARKPKPLVAPKGSIRGLFCGGTLCAEAQLILQRAGLAVRSNAPVPGAGEGPGAGHLLLDLGADEYTRGRPHPMIDPALRDELLAGALADRGVGVVLLDVVIGYGSHQDPAGLVAAALGRVKHRRALVIASVTGTDADPQGYASQVARLRQAGVLVCGSNAEAASLAASAIRSARRAGSRTRSGTRRSAGARPDRSAASRGGRR